jgi:hypothetical protein
MAALEQTAAPGHTDKDPVRRNISFGCRVELKGSKVEYGDQKGWGWDPGILEIRKYPTTGNSQIDLVWMEDQTTLDRGHRNEKACFPSPREIHENSYGNRVGWLVSDHLDPFCWRVGDHGS